MMRNVTDQNSELKILFDIIHVLCYGKYAIIMYYVMEVIQPPTNNHHIRKYIYNLAYGSLCALKYR